MWIVDGSGWMVRRKCRLGDAAVVETKHAAECGMMHAVLPVVAALVAVAIVAVRVYVLLAAHGDVSVLVQL